MALVINTNIASIQSERALATNRGNMEQAMQRLSSGKRINSAVDDAAGIAVAQRMRNQIQGLNMAIRNANDGISLAQTAEGAIEELQNILHRMRELAVQSSNGTYTSDDRSFISAEFEELMKEIRRTSNQAAWDGDLKLISENAKPMSVQVGISAADYIEIPLGSLTLEDLNLADRTTVNNTSGTQINRIDLTAMTGANASAVINTTAVLDTRDPSKIADRTFENTPKPNFELSYPDGSGVTGNLTKLTAVAATSVDDMVSQFKRQSAYDPTVVDIQNVGGELKLVWKIHGEQAPIEFKITNNTTDLTNDVMSAKSFNVTTGLATTTATVFSGSTAAASQTVTGEGFSAIVQKFDMSGISWHDGEVPKGAGNHFEIQVGGRTLSADNVTSLRDLVDKLRSDSDYHFVKEEAGWDQPEQEIFEIQGNTLNMYFSKIAKDAAFLRHSTNNVNIANSEDAVTALDFIDKAQTTINSMRARMGATMNRIEYTINNLMNIVENTEEAKSRILDTDYARESAELAKAQVLAQAGTAMLAQANQSQQYVLNLLRQG
jgi:flagellin